MMHKGYFTRNMLSKIQSSLYKELSASARLYLFPAPVFSCEPWSTVSDRASIVQCLQTSKENWLLPELLFVVMQGEVARAAQAP